MTSGPLQVIVTGVVFLIVPPLMGRPEASVLGLVAIALGVVMYAELLLRARLREENRSEAE